MKRTPTHPRREPTEAEIQHAAYLIWLEDGRPSGKDLEHWLTAKELLMHHHGRNAHIRRPQENAAAGKTR